MNKSFWMRLVRRTNVKEVVEVEDFGGKSFGFPHPSERVLTAEGLEGGTKSRVPLPGGIENDVDSPPFKELGHKGFVGFLSRTHPPTASGLFQWDRVSFLPLQKWEGVIKEVTKDSFIALLHDLTAPNEPEEVEIPLDELTPSDRKRALPGAFFYWTIGYYDRPVREKVSTIRMKGYPFWRVEHVEKGAKEGKELLDSIGWTSDDPTERR